MCPWRGVDVGEHANGSAVDDEETLGNSLECLFVVYLVVAMRLPADKAMVYAHFFQSPCHGFGGASSAKYQC